jgi:hypothetical protein
LRITKKAVLFQRNLIFLVQIDKKTFLLLSLFLSIAGSVFVRKAPKEEFRTTWLATVWNIDWPKTSATTTANRTAQQKELKMYDLLGRPVNENYIGIVIINSQKYLLK